MSFTSWMRNLQSTLASGRAERTHRRPLRAARYRPRLEVLEDRTVPSFAAPVSYPSGGDLVAVVAGDFNGDGKLDLVNANSSPFVSQATGVGVRFRAGNGDGTFGAAIDHPLESYDYYHPMPLAAADFNLDGRLDLAVAVHGYYLVWNDSYWTFDYYSWDSVLIMAGNGDGTFAAPGTDVLVTETAEGDGSVTSLAVGDFNGDGNPDVTATFTNSFGSGWGYALGNGDGTFQGGPGSVISYDGYSSLAAGDFNADLRTDLVLRRGTSLDILFGNTDGTFQTVSYATPGSRVVVGDFNGDGHPDINTSYSTGSLIMLNDGLGGFGPPIAGPAVNAGTVGDFDADGRDDLIGNGSVYLEPTLLYLSRGDGTFDPGLPIAYSSARAVADLNGDGYADLAGLYYTSGQQGFLGVQLNRADWSAAQTFVVTSAASSTTAGAPLTFTVTARNSYGQTVFYTGTVHFTSTDSQAVLPANYTFTAADNGVHTFTATLKTAGSKSLSVTDTVTAGLTGTLAGVTVNPAVASRLAITGPTRVSRGAAFSITVRAYDPYGNVATGYTGTVRFTSSDGTATLPANYTFTAADQGVHTFTGLVLRKKGNQKITVTDTLDGSFLGSLSIKVV